MQAGDVCCACDGRCWKACRLGGTPLKNESIRSVCTVEQKHHWGRQMGQRAAPTKLLHGQTSHSS